MDEMPQPRRKALIGGIGLIAYGILGGLYSYWRDSNSMDFFAMSYAVQGAVTHALLFGVVGLGFIAWSRRRETDSE